MALDWDLDLDLSNNWQTSHRDIIRKQSHSAKVLYCIKRKTSGQSKSCHKAASPHTDGPFVFARWRQRAPQETHASFDPPEFATQAACRSVQPFCTAHGRVSPRMPGHVLSTKNCPFAFGIWTPFNTFPWAQPKSITQTVSWTVQSFLQLAQCSHCKHCISYGNSVCLSVRPSIRPSVRHTPVLCQNDGT